MAYKPSVDSKINLATTSATSPSLNNTLFVAAHKYFTERVRGYSSFDEVRSDPVITTGSNAYNALRLAFSRTAAVPIYLGRREATQAILEPAVVGNATDYGLTVTVIKNDDKSKVSTDIKFTSDSSATAQEIVTGLVAAFSSASNVTVVNNSTNLSITPDTGYDFTISNVKNLKDSFVTAESAADLLSAIMEEDDESWYFLTCEDHTEAFVLAMAKEIQATEQSDKPKEYHVSTQQPESITSLAEPAVDILGKLKEGNFSRTSGKWHHSADSNFIEVADTAYNGQFTPGVTTWKFLPAIPGIPAAADPVTLKPLSTNKQGHLAARNASWYGFERGVNFAHGGKMASGEYIDVIQAKDYLNNLIEVRLLNLLLNQPGGKIPFTPGGKGKVKNVIDGVLKQAVDLGILSGYVPTTIPENTPFEDQAARILQQVKWTGYLAGAIHFIVVSGILTYKDETLS